MANPPCCKKGSDHPSAKVFPLEKSPRQVAMLDPKTMKYTFVDTCFSTHHPQFGYDADNTLWFSGTGPVAGWIDTKVFDETRDTQKAQGWAPWVLDINGNGKLDDYHRAGRSPTDPPRTRASPPVPGHTPSCRTQRTARSGTPSARSSGPPGFLRFDPKTKLSDIYYVRSPASASAVSTSQNRAVAWPRASST